MAAEPSLLKWRDLSDDTRAALSGKLAGLFGWAETNSVFESLAVERQQALLLILQRMQELRLWDSVHFVTNVYGEGGVGINFVSWPNLRSILTRRADFTTRLAGHRNNEGGFRERKKKSGPALHMVIVKREGNLWAAHFDLYDPLLSVKDFWRHIYRESWRRQLPNWRQIADLNQE
jgi:hypothetical protein